MSIPPDLVVAVPPRHGERKEWPEGYGRRQWKVPSGVPPAQRLDLHLGEVEVRPSRPAEWIEDLQGEGASLPVVVPVVEEVEAAFPCLIPASW